MKECLFVDCCIRKDESRTKVLADAFFSELSDEYHVTHLDLPSLNLQPLVGDFFFDRQKLLDENNLDHPRFKYAHQLVEADLVVVAAPFWDLSFPALLKIWVENCSLDGITFKAGENGLVGQCKGTEMVYLTTRGGFYTGEPFEQGIPYMSYISKFFGIDHFDAIAADGMDVVGFDGKASLDEACEKAKELAKTL